MPSNMWQMDENDSSDVSSCDAFANYNGGLVCDSEPNKEGVPQGTYLDSCGGCNVSVEPVEGEDYAQTVLRCSACKDSDGSPHNGLTELIIDDCNLVGNNHGKLVCEDARHLDGSSQGLPDGPYLQTCKGCSYFENHDPYPILRCSSCQHSRNGVASSARLSLQSGINSCHSISNQDGRLVCVEESAVTETETTPATTTTNEEVHSPTYFEEETKEDEDEHDEF
eukprot:CAMPEP_0198141350 /NCGR_PEP_ID=MMETSP1443-20131203/4381_1 /TAXON_ID=186043 /ORGANISM="Entomoneis sp., Strain CCMP2396" /LENGTH=223 /DNA_ID=CAMNT_0043804079 /DNA_START=234 /DNA_END=906 /DNA_ORIENTATION=+